MESEKEHRQSVAKEAYDLWLKMKVICLLYRFNLHTMQTGISFSFNCCRMKKTVSLKVSPTEF